MRSFAENMLISTILAITLHSSSSYGEDVDREQLIQQLILCEEGVKQQPIEALVARTMLLQARQANPNVDQDTWLTIQSEADAAVAKMVAQGGGGIETMTRAGVASLSNEELIHLVSIYRDPILVKYTNALASPVIEAQLRQASMASGLRVRALINSVLEKNGLQDMR